MTNNSEKRGARLNNLNCLVTRVQKHLYISKPSCSSRKVGISEGTNSEEDPPDKQHNPQEPRSKRERLQQFLGARIGEQEVFPETWGHLCPCITAELGVGSRSRESDPPVGMSNKPSSAPLGQLCRRGPCKGTQSRSSLSLHRQKFRFTDLVWGGLNCAGPSCPQLRSLALCTQPNIPGQKKSDRGDLLSCTLKPWNNTHCASPSTRVEIGGMLKWFW